MTTKKLPEALIEKLRAPFDPADISWKPQTVNYSSKTALAVAYADPRAYADRLNEVFGVGSWSDTYAFIATPFNKFIKGKKAWKDTPATEDKQIPGNKVLVVATITVPEYGVSISSTGDSDAADENAATSAEAQAFKRAAMKLGLGRYLYELPKVTARYDNGWTDGPPQLPDWALPATTCQECSQKIVSITQGDKTYSIAALVKNSQAKYKQDLCASCQKSRTEAIKEQLGRPIA
jgi:hypothetical protein